MRLCSQSLFRLAAANSDYCLLSPVKLLLETYFYDLLLLLSSSTSTIPLPQEQCHSLKVETKEEGKFIVIKCKSECFVNLFSFINANSPLNELSV